MSENLPITPGDLSEALHETLDCVLVVIFPRTKSLYYPLAITLARQAKRFRNYEIEGKLVHWAAFDVEQSAQALAMTDHVHRITGGQMYAGGRSIDCYAAQEILKCIIAARLTNDYRAHCNVVLTAAELYREHGPAFVRVSFDANTEPPKAEDEYLFPCALLRRKMRISRNHPSTMADQIQAAAVASNCEWCPNLKPNDFMKL